MTSCDWEAKGKRGEKRQTSQHPLQLSSTRTHSQGFCPSQYYHRLLAKSSTHGLLEVSPSPNYSSEARWGKQVNSTVVVVGGGGGCGFKSLPQKLVVDSTVVFRGSCEGGGLLSQFCASLIAFIGPFLSCHYDPGFCLTERF